VLLQPAALDLLWRFLPGRRPPYDATPEPVHDGADSRCRCIAGLTNPPPPTAYADVRHRHHHHHPHRQLHHLEVTDPDNRPVEAPPPRRRTPPAPTATKPGRRRSPSPRPSPAPFTSSPPSSPAWAWCSANVCGGGDRPAAPRRRRSWPPSASNCDHFERTTAGSEVCQLKYGGVTCGEMGLRSQLALRRRPRGRRHHLGAGRHHRLTRNLDTGTGPPQLTANVQTSVADLVFRRPPGTTR